MSDPRAPTLDQLRVFHAVVEAGSFVGAARRLGRATSVVSYAVANLEAQLGLELFDRSTTRKPRLTDAGRAILSESRAIAMGLDGLLAKARGLIAGLEAEVAIVVDVMLPIQRLVEVLDAFRAAFPTVALRLYVEALGAVAQLVLDGVASVGVSGPLTLRPDGLEQSPLGVVKLIPVASPSHPLSRQKGPLSTSAARAHVQLVLTDRSPLTEGQEFGVIAVQTWLLAGVGWGSMPEAMVREDLAAGRLVRLAVDAWDNVLYPLQSLHRTERPPGPAARWLVERLRNADWSL